MHNRSPRFRLLGPLEIRVDDTAVVLTGRQRALCAVLLLHADRVVSVDRLAQGLWDERMPSASAARIRALVSEVRHAFGPDGAALLATRKPGYVLRAAPAEVDAFLFEALIRDGLRALAHKEWAEAYRYHDDALALWRGDPLPDLPTMEAERRRLTELRIAAEEGRAEAELELGRPRSAVADLVRLTSEHPLRERPHALLMRSLARDGRSPDALAVYTGLRNRMVRELGVDPSDELTELHRRLLVGDAAPRAAGSAPAEPSRHRWVPRQLPRAPHRFVGRNTELRLLDACRREDGAPAVIVGPAGAGKTALALHWAHRIADGYPDGQLFLDMRGFDNAGPMSLEEALPLLLQGLGCAPHDIPLGLDAQTALYRTLLAGRRVLVVLDDVADASTVRRLLPSTSGSLTLVTSRRKLNGLVLDGAHRVTCDVLSREEALELFGAAIGADAVAADPGAAAHLVELCDHLPLALCVAGSWIGTGAGSVRAYVTSLAERGRLARLHVEGEESVAVRAALDLSYGTLPDEAKWVFRSLGLIPGTGRSVAATAAGAGLDESHTADLLRLAQRVHLLRDTEDGRTAWHDLVHEYAVERVVTEDAEAERARAVDRLLDHYLQSVSRVAVTCRLYCPQPRPEPVGGSVPRTFRTPEEAFAWFDEEWEDIAAAIAYAAEHGPARFAWQIVDALQDLFHHRRPLSDWLRLAALAGKAAERGGDRRGQAVVHLSSGHALWRSGDFRGALGAYESAQLAARDAGWLSGEARSAQGTGVTLKLLGEPREALPFYDRALTLYRTLGMTEAEKIMLTNTASLQLALGRLAEAEEAVTAALALDAGTQGHLHSMTLVNHALVQQKQARFRDAAATLRKGLEVSRASESLYAEAVMLETLGRVRDDAGQDARALLAYEDALGLARRVGNRNCQVDSLVGLASLELRTGRTREAAAHLDDARTIAEETGHRTGLIEILLVRGALHCAEGRYREAAAVLETAGGLAVNGSPLTLPRIRSLSAVALRETGETTAATEAAREAVEQARHSGQRLVLARALTALAAAREAAGDVRSPAGYRDEAETLFDAIGVPSSCRTATGRRTATGHRGADAAPDRSPAARIPAARGARPPLPDDAAERLARYLADHFDDLTDDGPGTGGRL
ncbi:AfsR/SARP family transcriptional regulator [Streptomyces coelicoflavus]|uniref:AfsR/SARP family transcriptional regulator n=1 Tax=Streptomyces coelicoflavus TaxID=285562 RepID=UPI0036C60469